MSDDPRNYDPGEDPTEMMDSTEEEGYSELPRRGYERRMSPPPPPRNYSPPPRQSTGPQQAVPPPNPSRINYRPVEPGIRQTNTVPPPRSRRDSPLYLPWWSLVILVLVVGIGAAALLIAALELGDNITLGNQTPQVIVVTNALPGGGGQTTNNQNPIGTPGGVPPTAAPIASAVPTVAPTQTPRPGVSQGCPLGSNVQVVGTGAVGLSIRTEPRQGDNIRVIANEGDLFTITDGPQQTTGVDGSLIEWCLVSGITDSNASGWAARAYLAEVE